MLIHAMRALLVLLTVLVTTQLRAADVEFVVGDYMEAEGGSWTTDKSPLSNPFGIDFDSKGTMYIVELVGGRVYRLGSDHQVTRIAGDGTNSYSGDLGPANRATFNGMHNCAITGDDQLLIADSWNHCVRRINLATGVIETIIGTGEAGFSGDGGAARGAAFDYVMCISLNPDKNRLHITDLKNARIREVDLASMLVRTVAGNGDQGIPEDGSIAINCPLVDPRAAASAADGSLYVLERSGHALRVVDPSGYLRTVAGTGKNGFRDGPALEAEFGSPKHLCLDGEGNVYIADDLNGAIRRFNPRTKAVETVLGRGAWDERVQLLHPHGVCVHDGMLYVIDSGNNRILRRPLPE